MAAPTLNHPVQGPGRIDEPCADFYNRGTNRPEGVDVRCSVAVCWPQCAKRSAWSLARVAHEGFPEARIEESAMKPRLGLRACLSRFPECPSCWWTVRPPNPRSPARRRVRRRAGEFSPRPACRVPCAPFCAWLDQPKGHTGGGVALPGAHVVVLVMRIRATRTASP